MNNEAYPLISIAIPTYNRADSYLTQALQSALNQTYKNIEIIVSDNCSRDNTEMVVSTFNDKRIRYFRHKENIGANNNFNFCLKQAKGSYFLLLQDDDLIDKDFVETCMRTAHFKTDSGIIRTGTRIIDSQGKVRSEVFNRVGGLSTEDFFRGWFKGKTSLYLCSTLFHTERLREIGGFKSKRNLFQDVVAEVQLAARFGRLDIEDIKAGFRKHSGENTFAARVKDWCEDSLMLLDLMCELAGENRELIRREGMRFFANLNYRRARAVKSPYERLQAYLTVFKKFDYSHLPSVRHVLSPFYSLLRDTPIHSGLRFIKKRLRHAQAGNR
jgi:glycosyltransferase involved in cell wall biosynthesis